MTVESAQTVSLDSIRQIVQEDYDAVNQLINNNLHLQIDLISQLTQHIIRGGGKKLRPLLVLLSAKACQYSGSEHILLAAAIEYFHTATLLHDDVVDESKLRRGQQTANTIWGSKASILVGDYLFTQAFQILVNCDNTQVFATFAEAANLITLGEVQQLTNRYDPKINEQQYMTIIHYKTASLFATAAKIGAILAARPQNEIAALYDYGLHLGLAFQLIDDALDYCSSAEVIGKNIGDDLAEGKLTLPLIYALHHGQPEEQQLIRDVIQQGSLKHLDEILTVIKTTKAIDHTQQIAVQQIDKAFTVLEILPHSIYKQGLQALAEFCLQRQM